MPATLAVPRQKRAIESYERLLRAAQTILQRDGYEGLTTNTIAQEAGLTPPTCYRYFEDKQSVLVVLAERLMAAQNTLAVERITRFEGTADQAAALVRDLFAADIAVTRDFVASHELMVLMRALPGLRAVRLASHDRMAQQLIAAGQEFLPDQDPQVLAIRARLAVELYYSTHEMLAETGYDRQTEMIEQAARIIGAMLLGKDL